MRIVNVRCGHDGRYMVDADRALPFDTTRTYTITDTVIHPKFGLGRVIDVQPTSVEVLFGNEARRLRHGAR